MRSTLSWPLPAGPIAIAVAMLSISVKLQAQAASPIDPLTSISSTTPARPATPVNPAQNGRTPNDRLLPLEVFINSSKGGVWTLLERNGILFAPEDAFKEWRLNRRTTAQEINFQGQKWYSLTSIAGFEARLNYANQSIELVFSPTAFSALHLTQEPASRPALSPPILAFFANYDLNYTTGRVNTGDTKLAMKDLGVLTELGASGPWGLFTSSHVGRSLVSQNQTVSPTWRRLESTYTQNFLDSNATLRLGDATTRSGLAGRPVYFGGVQFTRNFSLQPGFVTRPIPSVAGLSTAPSTVELYINDALRQTSKVPTGPFSISNFPSITGSGEARVVVRDILGRESVITQSFFSNANLLENDLSDWSVEVGAIRRNLGIDNANYGPRFASGLWRQGISQSLTLEGSGEWSQPQRRAGLGASFQLPFGTLGQTALATSRNQNSGNGSSLLAGIERNGLRHGFSLNAQSASRNYRQLGIDIPSPRRQSSASYSYTADVLGSFGVSFASVDSYDTGRFNTLSLNYSLRVGKQSSLTLRATQLGGVTTGTLLAASLVVPFEDRITAIGGLTTRSGTTESYLTANRALTSETGWGWRTAVGRRQEGTYSEGGTYYQGTKGLLTADASSSQTQQNLRLGLLGGFVLADGRGFATRRVEDSFAIVEVPGYANVGIGFQGTTLTRTNADGVALLSRLLPFQSNSVRLNPSELPISAELDSIEMEAVPALRGGVKVTFPVRSGRGALVKIVLDDGLAAPAGAEIELTGDKKEFFVARRGEAFVTGLQTDNVIRLKWNSGACNLAFKLAAGQTDDIARVGPLLCSGVTR